MRKKLVLKPICMSKKILVTGANGQLGSEIRKIASDFAQFQFYFTGRQDLDISDQDQLEKFISAKQFQSVINCAAYTAVDAAEDEQEKAALLNSEAVKNLAKICVKENIQLIHISTDYVFNGNSDLPYQTNSATDPINRYGKTKRDGEFAVLNAKLKRSLIIRTSWLYSSFRTNFVKTMLRLGREKQELNVVNDQFGSPTYAADLAEFILRHALRYQEDKTQIFHFSNKGTCTWFDLAQYIMSSKGYDCKINPVTTANYPTRAKRPLHSVLDTSRTEEYFDVQIRGWKKALDSCLEKLNSEKAISNEN